MTDLKTSLKQNWKYVLAAVAGVILLPSTINYNDSGVSTRVQTPIIGYTWHMDEGFYFKLPFLSRERSYTQRGTVSVTDNEDIIEASVAVSSPRTLQFSDSYLMKVEYSFRYALPDNPEGLEEMHQAVKSEANLLGNTIIPFSLTLAADTAQQLEAGSFAQGGRNEYRTLMDDQAVNGMYVTKVQKVKIVAENADTSSNKEVANATKEQEQFVRRVTYVMDEKGNRKRMPNPLASYGIQIQPNSVALIQADPVDKLVEYIANKQKNLALQIAQEEQQKLLREEAKTIQLEGAKNLIAKQNTLKLENEGSILTKEKEVEEAGLQAEKERVEAEKAATLALIDKERERKTAEANEAIQKANYAAAQYEAKAKLEVGLAEARVDQAKYAAIDKGVLSLEVDKAKALALYNSNMKVTMPTYVGGSAEGGMNNIEAMSSLKVMEMLGNSASKQ